ncbi:MAG: ATP-binding protein, partial [Rhizomicrobium sp.]
GKTVQHVLNGIVGSESRGDIEITIVVARGQVTIRIRDPKVHDHDVNPDTLFDVFSDGLDHTATKYGAVGISLALGLKFAQFIGGGISVENDVENHRVFVIAIPAAPALAGTTMAAA